MPKTKNSMRQGLLYSGVMLSLIGSTSHAQESDANRAANSGVGQLPEVIVTAQRREQNLQQTPVAVSAFTSQDLEQKDVRNLRDLIQTTPNLQIYRISGSRNTQVVFAIRGFNLNGAPLGAQPPVGIYIDDIFYPALSGALLRVTDLESLEVLRGPQGTLFGRNSLGGAVRYNSIQPGHDFAGHVDLALGDRNRQEVSGAVNLPLGDKAALRFSGGSFKLDGFLKNQFTGAPVGSTDEKVARVQLRLTPSDNVTADVTAEYSESKIDGDDYVIDRLSFTTPFVTQTARGPVTTAALLVPPTPGYDQRYVKACNYCSSGSTFPEIGSNIIQSLRANLAWNVTDSLTLKSLSSAFNVATKGRSDGDHSIFNSTNGVYTQDLQSYSQEFQANGSLLDSRLNYTGGVYFFTSDQNLYDITYSAAPTATPTLSGVNTVAYAAYAQVSYDILPRLAVTVGAREGHEEVEVYTGTPISTTIRPPKGKYDAFTPQAKLQFQATPDFMIYVSAAKGFRGGTINALNAVANPQIAASLATSAVQPDSAWSYEVGVRSEFFDRRLQVNATAFRADYTDMQLSVLYPPICVPGRFCLPIPAAVSQNAGDSQIQGIEIESQAVLGDFRFTGTLATLDTKYKTVNPLTGINLGTYFEHAPKLTYSLGVTYSHDLPIGSILANLDYSWRDDQVAGVVDLQSSVLPAYELVDARVAWRVNDHVTASIAGRNLFDTYYVRDAIQVEFATGQKFVAPGEPRTWSASVQYKF